MQRHDPVHSIEESAWLDPASDATQQALATFWETAGPAGRTIKNFLHGTWLGHALHPVLTDVPVGAWTTGLLLDAAEGLFGRTDLGPGADAAVTIGLVGAAGAALTGITDWSATDGGPRRLGLVHGLLNLGASALYAASLRERLRGRRARGRTLALLGFAGVATSAYLGGHLVYARRIGVNHADVESAPSAYTPVISLSDLAEAAPRRIEVQGMPLVLVRRGGQVYALAETCSHLGGPLSEGQIDENSITCPWHGSRFALDDGRVLDGPATICQPRFPVRLRNGQVEVELPGAVAAAQGASPPPGANDATAAGVPPKETTSDDWLHLTEARANTP